MEHQGSLGQTSVFDKHEGSVIGKHDKIIHEYREIYRTIMTPIWNNYDRVVGMDSEYLLDSQGERIYKIVVDDRGNETKKYQKDPLTSIFDNKGSFKFTFRVILEFGTLIL